MGLIGDTFRTLKPVVYTAWVVAAVRLVLDATSTDPNMIASASVYTAVFVLFLFSAFTGFLDRLAWKGVFVGALMLGVLVWFAPNLISYTVAQFQGWNHTRYYVDQEHWAVQKRLMEEEDVGFFDAADRANEVIGRKGQTRGPPRGETSVEKLEAGLTVAGITVIPGALWSLVLGILLVGIPASVRRRRT